MKKLSNLNEAQKLNKKSKKRFQEEKLMVCVEDFTFLIQMVFTVSTGMEFLVQSSILAV